MNPYIAGSPVTGTEMFFGREDVFSFVRRNLTGRHRDTPIVLYGQRRTGKTSALYQMHRHLDARYRCIFIDLHGLSLNGVENLLWGIANSIRRSLQRDHQLSIPIPDRAAFSANPQAAFETTFLDAVWSILGEDHLVLMIDEVVRLHEEVRATRLERDVFDYLRHLMQHFERLNFVFSLGSGVEEMKKDYAFLFGVALYHRISFLEPGAARALVTKPAQGCYQVTPDAVEKIVQLTSGHPYYAQLVCHCLFDRWLRVPKPQMTSADVEAVLTEAIELGSANLTYVWEDSTPEEKATMAALAAAIPARDCPATVEQIREVWRQAGMWLPEGEAGTALRNLTAREVTVATAGAYSFTVDLQRLWLDKHRRLDWVKEELGGAAREWDQPAKAPERSRRRRTWGWGAAGIATLIAAGAGVAFFGSGLGSGRSSHTPRQGSALTSPVPTNVKAAAVSQYAIRVTWSDKGTKVRGFDIDNVCPAAGCGTGGTLAQAVTHATTAQFAVTPGTYECFKVRAVRMSGSSAWSSVACTSTRALAVQATRKWTDTGVTLHAGDKVGITATGKLYIGAAHPLPVGPIGVPTCTYHRGRSALRGYFPAPTLTCWSLIGKIGKGAPFEVGRSALVTATSGRLYMEVNDNRLADNAGHWSVRIKLGGLPPS